METLQIKSGQMQEVELIKIIKLDIDPPKQGRVYTFREGLKAKRKGLTVCSTNTTDDLYKSVLGSWRGQDSYTFLQFKNRTTMLVRRARICLTVRTSNLKICPSQVDVRELDLMTCSKGVESNLTEATEFSHLVKCQCQQLRKINIISSCQHSTVLGTTRCSLVL